VKSGSLVVRQHSIWRGRLVQLGLVLGIAALSVGLYYFGQYRAGHNLLQSSELQAKLEASISELQADKAVLRDRIAVIEQTTEVDKQAYLQVKEDLRKLQQENLELREEVSFYRGIVAPRESSGGIRVDSFKIEKANDKGLFHYKFVLTQVLKNHRSTRGQVKIKIHGIEKGKPKKLDFTKVSANNTKRLDFKFRYFQKFDGDIQIPAGFTPREVKLEVHPFKRKIVKASFQWPGVNNKVKESEKTAKDAG